MPLFIASLNSGSNGNCYYIGNDSDAVLIDVGISCREVEKRMLKLDLSIARVKALFVSHEHIDHVSGVSGLSKKHDLPVYITPLTLASSQLELEKKALNFFVPYQGIRIGAIEVISFPKSHDAVDPHSFVVCADEISIGVFTDIGHICQHVREMFSRCHAVFLEANYCSRMLTEGKYPDSLKRRIQSGTGHLSNSQALDLFKRYKGIQLQHLILSHLSEDNNSPSLVRNLFESCAGNIRISVASRHEETGVFRIWKPEPARLLKKQSSPKGTQLSLFESSIEYSG